MPQKTKVYFQTHTVEAAVLGPNIIAEDTMGLQKYNKVCHAVTAEYLAVQNWRVWGSFCSSLDITEGS